MDNLQDTVYALEETQRAIVELQMKAREQKEHIIKEVMKAGWTHCLTLNTQALKRTLYRQ